jgi:hypothetical protein
MIEGRISQAENDNTHNIPQLIFQSQKIHTPLLLSTLTLMNIKIPESPELIEVIETVAGVMGLIETVRMIPQDLKNQKIRIPQEVMNKHGLTSTNIWDQQIGHPNNDLFDAVLE